VSGNHGDIADVEAVRHACAHIVGAHEAERAAPPSREYFPWLCRGGVPRRRQIDSIATKLMDNGAADILRHRHHIAYRGVLDGRDQRQGRNHLKAVAPAGLFDLHGAVTVLVSCTNHGGFRQDRNANRATLSDDAGLSEFAAISNNRGLHREVSLLEERAQAELPVIPGYALIAPASAIAIGLQCIRIAVQKHCQCNTA
jgi:hypothetical protein